MTKKSSSSNSSLERIKKLFKRNKTVVDTSNMTWMQYAWHNKFTILFLVVLFVVLVLVLVFLVYIPNKNIQDAEKEKKNVDDAAKAKTEAEKKEKDKVFSKLSTQEIKEQERIDDNYKKSRVKLFGEVNYNNPIDDTYNKINYKINTEKSLITDVTVSSNSGINSIKISNCKVNLKNANGGTLEYKHFMVEPDNWFKTNLLEKYHVAKITIMSEIILYDSDGKIIDSGLNKIDITDINRKDLPDIQFSGFKIRNCKIFLYPEKNFIGKEEIFNHSSKDDNVNEPDDSKCFLYKSFGKTIFKSIKIESFRP
jgi:competence protein ComGC